MMMITFGTYEQAFPQLRYRTYVIAIRTFGPQPFWRFFFFSRTGQNAFFDALEPATFTFLTLPIIPGKVRLKIIFMFHVFSICLFNGLMEFAAILVF